MNQADLFEKVIYVDIIESIVKIKKESKEGGKNRKKTK